MEEVTEAADLECTTIETTAEMVDIKIGTVVAEELPRMMEVMLEVHLVTTDTEAVMMVRLGEEDMEAIATLVTVIKDRETLANEISVNAMSGKEILARGTLDRET